MRTLRRFLPLLIAIVLLLTFFAFVVPAGRFLTVSNLLDLTQQISLNAILAFGMTLAILIGGIDLSVGAVVALAGTVAVSVLPGVSWPGAVLSAIGTAAGFGLVNGVCAARTRMPPFIITLATMLVARGLALRFNEGRPLPVPDSQTVFLAFGNARLFGVLPMPAIIMLGAFALTALLL